MLIFYFGRSKPKQPTKLHMRDPVKTTEDVVKNEDKSFSVAREVGNEKSLQAPKQLLIESSKVFFMYNGHEWDAHEVLGIQRDLDFSKVTAQYQKLIKTSDPSTFEFYDSAYSAILKTRSG